MNQLDQLREMTTVVADTGDIDAIRDRHPTDATTNPSLLLKAAQQDTYRPLLEAAIDGGREAARKGEDRTTATMTRLAVNFGCEILKLVPGRVSTEVDARLSFDRDATVKRAEQIIQLYSDAGVSPERILIKIASTWEGIAAATLLEKRGIHCNMTLLFHFAQAQACADAGATLISPFVGRITDWYKAHDGVDAYAPDDDPGVQSVRRIYAYYKQHGFPTEIMGASFRNIDQILALAGCDLLTISPDLMDELAGHAQALPRRLSPTETGSKTSHATLSESDFRWAINDDAMATEKLAEGIRRFAQDTEKLAAFTHTLCKDCP